MCIWGVHEAQIYLYQLFCFFVSFFLQSCLWWDTSTSSFVNQQICLCIFQCFWDKNMLHIVSSILACVCTVIWYNTLYSCFVFPGISIFQTIPSASLETLSCSFEFEPQQNEKYSPTRGGGRYTASDFELVVAGVEKWQLFFNAYIKAVVKDCYYKHLQTLVYHFYSIWFSSPHGSKHLLWGGLKYQIFPYWAECRQPLFLCRVKYEVHRIVLFSMLQWKSASLTCRAQLRGKYWSCIGPFCSLQKDKVGRCWEDATEPETTASN